MKISELRRKIEAEAPQLPTRIFIRTTRNRRDMNGNEAVDAGGCRALSGENEKAQLGGALRDWGEDITIPGTDKGKSEITDVTKMPLKM